MIKNNLYRNELNKIKLSIPSSQQIFSFCSGEVFKSDTLNYDTLKTVKGGLFCDKTFGSSSINTCFCGKLVNFSKDNLVCKHCEVEVSSFRARRYRMGYIKLNGFFINTLFFKSVPYFLSLFLGISLKKIENVLYNNYYLVLFPYKELKFNSVLSFDNYIFYLKKYKNNFFAETSFEAIRLSLNYFDLRFEFNKIKKILLNNKNYNSINYKKFFKKYKLFDFFINNGLSLNSIFMEIFPVLPPDLRPIVKLSDDKLISSDLNELYKRLIVRNKRLNKIKSICFSNLIINNENRLIQESINNIIYGNKKRNIFSDYDNDKIYKSIIDNLKGKSGFFRKNLLGKRVDFSGRAVIVSAPYLNINECSIPKKIAIELFRPFIYRKIISKKKVNIKRAKIEVDNKSELSLSILKKIVKNNYVLLNRAPTLHKLGMQSFKIKLNNDNVIKLHPLVCSAFNADFDGDQMAIHIPISLKSKNEFKTILLSSNNILLPSSGEISIAPTQDIVLGVYYATKIINEDICNKNVFFRIKDLRHYYDLGYINLNTKIFFRFKKYKDFKNFEYEIKETTYGRILIYNILPKNIDFSEVNKVLRKSDLSDLLKLINYNCGMIEVANFSNKLMKLGFSFSTQSGISISMDDMLFYEKKNDIIDNAKLLTMYYNIDYLNGSLSLKNKKKKIVDIWDASSELIFNFTIEKFIKDGDRNSLYKMIDSGSRGSDLQIKQICCMRGVINYKDHGFLDIPIFSSLREGLSVLEYFYFSHSSRKTLADTALKTSVAGYLTRRLVEVSNNIIVMNIDCFTSDGIIFKNLTHKGSVIENFYERILGRVISDDISRSDGSILYKKGTLITDDYVKVIKSECINYLKIRSPITCRLSKGICSFCYGVDLGKGNLVNLGVAVGVIAAQSIGEPGTQLTMRTFHTGGALDKEDIASSLFSNNDGIVQFLSLNYVLNVDNEKIVISNSGKILIKDKLTKELLETFNIPYSSLLLVEDNSLVNSGDILCKWDVFNKLIIADRKGYIKYENLIENLNCVKRFDNISGKFKFEVLKNIINFPGFIKICEDYDNCSNFNSSKIKLFPNGILEYIDNDYVNAGDILYKAYISSSKSSDITGGLPKIINLFEARVPKNPAFLSNYDGYIFFDYKKHFKYLLIKDKFTSNILFKKRFNLDIQFSILEGTFVYKGDVLIDGDYNPHDILKIYGEEGLLNFYLSEIKSIYYSQGVKINDKHIEIILREMLCKVFITDPVNTNYIIGDVINKRDIVDKNKEFLLKKLPIIKYNNILLGITKISLHSDSFLSSASFQQTTSVLNTAAVFNKIDKLNTLKTDVMLGKSVPIGTGFYKKILKNKKNKNVYYKSINKKKKKKKTFKKQNSGFK